MATYIRGQESRQLQRNLRSLRARKEQVRKQSELKKAQEDLEEQQSKGSLLGSAGGLLLGLGLTMAFGGLGAGAAIKALAASPIASGAAAGVGSMVGERLATRDEIEDIEDITEGVGYLTGPGASEFYESVDETYGDVAEDAKTSALLKGLTRGLQVGTMAGGISDIGNLFEAAESGSMLANIGEKIGFEAVAPVQTESFLQYYAPTINTGFKPTRLAPPGKIGL